MKAIEHLASAPVNVSEREYEVLELTSLGFTAPEIAKSLFLSVWTIRSHKKTLIRKLGCHTAAAAVRRGFEMGLLTVQHSSINF